MINSLMCFGSGIKQYKTSCTVQDEAQKKYIELVNQLAGAASESETPVETGKYKTLLVERDGKAFKITLNRPSKKNAITYEVRSELNYIFIP